MEKQELKYRFFGMHTGSDFVWTDKGNRMQFQSFGIDRINADVIGSVMRFPMKGCQVLLKPLSEISEEEAMECARIATHTPNGRTKIDVRSDLNISVFIGNVDFWIYFTPPVNFGAFPIGRANPVPIDYLAAADYLRSKNYCLPFHGLDPFEEGWAVKMEKK